MAVLTIYKNGDTEHPFVFAKPWGIYNLEGLSYPDVGFETESYAFNDGSYWISNQAEKRVVSFSFICREHDSNHAKRNLIGQFFTHRDEYDLYWDIDGRTAYIPARCTDFQLPVGKGNALLRGDIEFTAVNPFLQSVEDFGRDLNEVVPKVHFPSHYSASEVRPYSARAFSSVVAVDNSGSVPTGFVLDVNLSEDITSFAVKLYDGTGADRQVLKKIELANHTWEAGADDIHIDTEKRIICRMQKQNGVNVYDTAHSYLRYMTLESELFALDSGTNYIGIEMSSGQSTSTAVLRYRAKRLVF